MAQKSENLWIFNGEEKENLIRSHFRRLIWLEDLHRVGGDVGEFFLGGRGGGLYFSRCGRSSIRFWSWLNFLDFPEGLSCR